MENKALISTDHPDHSSAKKINIPLLGTYPEFGYVWLDGICHTLTKNKKGTYSLKKTK